MHSFLFYNKCIVCLYMFRALFAHYQEVKSVLYSIWYHHTCRLPSGAQVETVLSQPVQWMATYRLRVLSHPVHLTATYRCDDTRCCINQC